jgi:para-nitrobenzyl esterase
VKRSIATLLIPVVAVTGGRIHGSLTPDGGAAFKGIPYAQPPVGDLRWRAPQPVVPWTGIREATRFSIPCTQLSEGWNQPFADSGGEDCLYLNVATPHWPVRERYPVLVFIHGGSNMAGDGHDAAFDERTLVHNGVVLVTINYRLGALGFLVHPELAAESPRHTSGNYGLLDQIAALAWIQHNIARFGGDPDRVTVMGESAGSYDIGLLMSSPLARGLFQHAIRESGAVGGYLDPLTTGQATAFTTKLADRLHAPAQGTIHFLRTIPAKTILQEMQHATNDNRGGLLTTLDHYVVPDHPEAHMARMPIIIGSNAVDNVDPMSPPATESPDTDAVYGSPEARWSTDREFRCPSQHEAIAHARVAPTYLYEFQHPQPGHPFTWHNAELDFLWGRWPDDTTANAMRHYWVNFARTGDPNGPGLPPWPRLTADAQPYMAFTNDGPVVRAAPPRRAVCQRLDPAPS